MFLIVTYIVLLFGAMAVALLTNDDEYSPANMISKGLILVFCSILLITSFALADMRGTQNEEVIKFKAAKETIAKARSSKVLSEHERAALLTTIISWNAWLAREKYLNAGPWDWFHVDETNQLEPLE